MAINARVMAIAVPFSVWTELRPFFVCGTAPRPQAARLKTGAIRCRSHFTVFVASGHPGFEIEFAIGRPAEISRAGVDHAIRNLQALENLLFDRDDFLVHRFGCLQVGRVNANNSTFVN